MFSFSIRHLATAGLLLGMAGVMSDSASAQFPYGRYGAYGPSFATRGFSLSIGSGNPYRYGGFGYSSFGVGGFGYGLPAVSPYSSFYRGYGPHYGYSPYYSNRTSVGLSIYASPVYGYVPTDVYRPSYRDHYYDSYRDSYHDSYRNSYRDDYRGYGVPGYSSEFSHQPEYQYAPRDYDHIDQYPESASSYSGSVDSQGSDLRPGMILPDGSKVLSVGPLGAPTESRTQANRESIQPPAGEPLQGEL